MEPAGSDHETSNAVLRRACDHCRTRKIRCDKRTPCSNCRSLNIACRSTGEGQKPHEPRRRVLISSEYERKIDLIEDRLGGIEQALRELLVSARSPKSSAVNSQRRSHVSPQSHSRPGSPAAAAGSDHAGIRGPGYTSNAAIEQHDPSSGFEGSSSLAAHSAYAREFLESAVSHSTPEMLSSPKISEALSSLKRIVDMQSHRRGHDTKRGQLPGQSRRQGARCDIRNLEMPPLELVLTVLGQVKEIPPSSFGGYIPFFTVDYFIEKCRDVYFCTDDYSDATFIAANFGLYNVFIELGVLDKEPAVRDKYQHYVRLCKDNLEAALANLNILMPANYESIVALTLGAMHGIEISKPSVSWTLASTAIHMCQMLGYHRLSSMEKDPLSAQRRKQGLFWSAYTILNMMSLRLGRASVVQDYDIAIPSPFETFADNGTWGTVCALWTKQAMIQNKVYALLYSPAALNQSERERVSHARQLAAELQSTVFEPFEQIMNSDVNINEVDLIYLRSDKVSRLAILTLIYRAIPASAEPESSSTFIPECIETARAALEHHQACVTALKETSEIIRCSYMHWAIFISPFVPFIVIFCYVIATSNHEDLTRLEDFIASLRPLCPFSQSIDRLHNLCSVLGNVARLYIEAKTRNQAGEDQTLVSVGQEFDAYLSALGLAPGNMVPNSQGYIQTDGSSIQTGIAEPSTQAMGFSASGVQAQSQDSLSVAEMSQAAQLGNWFSGNQYMMGLLEEGLFQFNPGS